MISQEILQEIGVKNNKNCASTRKSLKLCIVSVHSSRSKKKNIQTQTQPQVSHLGFFKDQNGSQKTILLESLLTFLLESLLSFLKTMLGNKLGPLEDFRKSRANYNFYSSLSFKIFVVHKATICIKKLLNILIQLHLK